MILVCLYMESKYPSSVFGEIQWLTPYWMYLLFRIRVGVIRVWNNDKNPGIKNKEEYLWAATVIHVSKDKLELMGVDKPPTIYIFKEIIKTIAALGYKTGFWTRANTGTDRTIEFTPKKRNDR